MICEVFVVTVVSFSEDCLIVEVSDVTASLIISMDSILISGVFPETDVAGVETQGFPSSEECDAESFSLGLLCSISNETA